MRFDNSYARLPERMYRRQAPSAVRAPKLIALNAALAEEMGLSAERLSEADWVEVFAGNRLPEGAEPLAQAYAGHQFGNFVPQLGDGRALLLGEHLGPDGRRWDVQLKGAGVTPFSRRGDGRAWLGPVLREYLVSEAMQALGVPTTRALAAVETGEPVLREGALPGAVLTRVASSHLRVGTFQFFAVRGDLEALQALTEMAIARHYPHAEGALGLLRAAVAAQARLIAQWMSLGFIHGVMNTDNSHVGGLTLDYGPCAFLDGYQPDKVFSSIDERGRYAYHNQPQIAVWNMGQFASCLLPLIDADTDRAVALATEVVQGYAEIYQQAWLERFRAKLGLQSEREGDIDLISELLDLMGAERADFTRLFRGLAEGTAEAEVLNREALAAWRLRWRARLAAEGRTEEEARAAMLHVNPAIIPRNHRIEEAIRAAREGDYAPFHRLEAALAHPFTTAADDPLRRAPVESEKVWATFCGT